MSFGVIILKDPESLAPANISWLYTFSRSTTTSAKGVSILAQVMVSIAEKVFNIQHFCYFISCAEL